MIKKTVLVSGASGFLGKQLIKQLIESKNYYIVGLTSRPDALINTFESRSDFTVLNVNNWTEKIEKDLDILINCAFPRSSDPRQLAVGLDFTEKLIKDAINFNIHSIINISSQSVYSQKDKSSPDETADVAPESLYGMAKYAAEKLVASLCEGSSNTVNYSNIRLASLTGIELEARMTNKFVKRAINGEKITVNGRGQKVSYLEVRDAASALLSMLKKDSSTWENVYNLGNYRYCSVLEIAEEVNNVAKKYNIPEIEIDLKEGQDDFNNLLNSSLFYEDFDWKPYYDIGLMIEDLFNYYTMK